MTIRRYLAGVVLGMGLLAAGCDPFTPEDFVIRVADVAAPESLQAGQPLQVTFFGLIGADQCARLREVERRVSATLLEVRFHGRREGSHCKQTPSQLEHQEIVQLPLQDPFTIRVLQPTGPPLERTVRILPAGG
jgi:hypothetical protein